jgi:uncharacterized repeat protein (TIGR02543 family)
MVQTCCGFNWLNAGIRDSSDAWRSYGSGDANLAVLDSKILFNKLEAGNYLYTIELETKCDKVYRRVLDHPFTVGTVAPSVNITANATTVSVSSPNCSAIWCGIRKEGSDTIIWSDYAYSTEKSYDIASWNLPSGKYTFAAQANKNGVEGEAKVITLNLVQRVTDFPLGSYTFRSALGNYMLDINGGSLGTKVHLWETVPNHANQIIKVESAGDGYYYLKGSSGNYIDADYLVGGSNGRDIISYPFNGHATMQWAIFKNTDGTYSFQNRENGLFLDVFNSETANGTRIQLFTNNGSNAQKWALSSATPATYTITYNANGGSGVPSSQTKTHDVALTLSSTKPTRTGYTFQGWATSSTATSATYQSSGSYTANSAATLYAVWKANTYTVKYNANGGSGAMFDSVHIYDTSTALSANAFTRTGYTFQGWATSATGSVAYTDKQSVSNLTSTNGATVTLYAVWKANPTYTVSYNANGGSEAPSSQTKTHDIALTLSSTKPTRTGYTFQGWSKYSDATSATYQSSGSYTANSTVTLYAVWKANTYTVKYNANGGSGTMADSSHTYGMICGLSANTFTRTGYTFQGWATSATGSVAYADRQSVFAENEVITTSPTPTDNIPPEKWLLGSSQTGNSIEATNTELYTTNSSVTLYAVWKANTYTVQYYNASNPNEQLMQSSTHTYDVAKQLPSYNGTRQGYKFAGWTTSTLYPVTLDYLNEESVLNLTFENNGIVKLYALWTPVSVVVTFDVQGGNCDLFGVQLVNGKLTALPVPTKEGYVFKGWYTALIGGEFVTTDTVFEEDTTIYAQYTTNITVAFDGQGGSYTSSGGMLNNGKISSLPTIKKEGYVFKGWFTAQTGGEKITTNTVFGQGETTIYAQWEAVSYTVILNANDGTDTMFWGVFIYGATSELKVNHFTRNGYTFVGWATEPDGSVVYADKESVLNLAAINGDVVNLYAVWEAVPNTIDDVTEYKGVILGIATSSDDESFSAFDIAKAKKSLLGR